MGEGEATDLLLDRLDAANLDAKVEDLVLAAAMGDVELDAAVGGSPPDRPLRLEAVAVAADRVYIDRITVGGFRGVAATSSMTLTPGPGVTLVVGRNGSGKSTFAEAAEVALSGDSVRWSDKQSTLWRAGWANEHHHGARHVRVDLRRDGVADSTKVERRWAADADFDAGVGVAQEPGQPERPIQSLGLATDLAVRRPFLSYDELGGLWNEVPSARHDRMNVLLGLEDWSAVEGRLRVAARDVGQAVKAATDRGKELIALAESLEDERAIAAVTALKRKGGWDLEDLEGIVTGTGGPIASVALLQRLAALASPDSDAVGIAATAVRDAADAADAVAGTQAERSEELAQLLATALEVHAHSADATCPVCGTGDVLGPDWRRASKARIEELRAEAISYRQAQGGLAKAVRDLRGFITEPPASLEEALAADETLSGVSELAAVWRAWAEPPDDARAMADHVELLALDMVAAVATVATSARTEHDARQDRWRPIAEQLAAWLPAATMAAGRRPLQGCLKEAAAWVASEASIVRDERFAPIVAQVRQAWGELRQDSNISVDDLSLDGTATRRRLEVDVSVDDQPSDAGVAVLSQGELHALSLAMFLPRATSEASPFRFVVIDDPVQAMDGARVDGLARVLSRVGTTHQVVVFSHDERLPDAFRSLGLDAQVLQVIREPGSSVRVAGLLGPAERAIDDARAIASSEPYPDTLRRQVVPGLCRRALEAVCVEVGRRLLLDAGTGFDEVEARIPDLRKLRSFFAFGLFGDGNRHGDVDDRLKKSPFPSRAVSTMIAANKGAHGDGGRFDSQDLISETEKLMAALRSM